MKYLFLNKLSSFLCTVILAEETTRVAQNSRTWRRQKETEQPSFCLVMQIRYPYFSDTEKQCPGAPLCWEQCSRLARRAPARCPSNLPTVTQWALQRTSPFPGRKTLILFPTTHFWKMNLQQLLDINNSQSAKGSERNPPFLVHMEGPKCKNDRVRSFTLPCFRSHWALRSQSKIHDMLSEVRYWEYFPIILIKWMKKYKSHIQKERSVVAAYMLQCSKWILTVLLADNRTLCITTEYNQATQNVTCAFKDWTESSVQNCTLPCTLSLLWTAEEKQSSWCWTCQTNHTTVVFIPE